MLGDTSNEQDSATKRLRPLVLHYHFCLISRRRGLKVNAIVQKASSAIGSNSIASTVLTSMRRAFYYERQGTGMPCDRCLACIRAQGIIDFSKFEVQ